MGRCSSCAFAEKKQVFYEKKQYSNTPRSFLIIKMKLLAMDIGGTYTRLAHCEIESADDFEITARYQLETPQAPDTGFPGFIDGITAEACPFLAVTAYDALAIAIAGPVLGQRAWPPNINWNLDLTSQPNLPRTFLLNDFAAQGYALLNTKHQEKLVTLRDAETEPGSGAVIGAGTGLGHCLLVPEKQAYRVIPSEAGQAGFVFERPEKDIELFFLDRYKQDVVTNDQVVSGRGLELLHQYHTGSRITAAAICENRERYAQTLDQFTQFYARACRQFCLTNCVTERLIISGGLAAKHPYLVQGTLFIEALQHAASHQHLLQQLLLQLNRDQQLGIEGIIEYSLEQLFPN